MHLQEHTGSVLLPLLMCLQVLAQRVQHLALDQTMIKAAAALSLIAAGHPARQIICHDLTHPNKAMTNQLLASPAMFRRLVILTTQVFRSPGLNSKPVHNLQRSHTLSDRLLLRHVHRQHPTPPGHQRSQHRPTRLQSTVLYRRLPMGFVGTEI
ncbi:MAG: hypothetical protein EA400_13200 [Chromatiaceae bacterium]|nr:MAG: hypothetical protein EA400_13200 [Chromatiaceae bacterium]